MHGVPIVVEFAIQTIGPLRLPIGHASLTTPGPVVPGTAVKGAARRSAATIAEALRLAPCLSDGDARCPLCRLFGAPGVAGAVHWSAAALAEGTQTSQRPDLLDERRRQPVDRALGTNSGLALPPRMALPAGLRLSASVRGWLSGDGRADAALLAASLLQLRYLAGGSGAGFGRVAVAVDSLYLAGTSQDVDALFDSLVTQEVV